MHPKGFIKICPQCEKDNKKDSRGNHGIHDKSKAMSTRCSNYNCDYVMWHWDYIFTSKWGSMVYFLLTAVFFLLFWPLLGIWHAISDAIIDAKDSKWKRSRVPKSRLSKEIVCNGCGFRDANISAINYCPGCGKKFPSQGD